jgi:hypothetical protein
LVLTHTATNRLNSVSIGHAPSTWHAPCRFIFTSSEKTMRLSSLVLVAVSLSCAAHLAIAQSTLAEPYVIQGDQGRSIAANAALASAAMQGQNKTSPQEFARREQHKAEIKACRENYRTTTRSGSPQRKAARDACEKKYQAQRATWYAKK